MIGGGSYIRREGSFFDGQKAIRGRVEGFRQERVCKFAKNMDWNLDILYDFPWGAERKTRKSLLGTNKWHTNYLFERLKY